MPTELPGLYWDEQRNRYFPLSSQPKPFMSVVGHEPPCANDPKPKENVPKHKRNNTLWNTVELSRETCSTRKRYRATHKVLSSHYAYTSRVVESRIPTYGRIKVFCATILNGEPRRFIGDCHGWLYTSTQSVTGQDLWYADVNLRPQSDISSICISGNHCVATAVGKSAKISIQDLNVTGRMSLLTLNAVHDVWASHLQDTALVLGAYQKAVYLPHIDLSSSVETLDTQSDVFAVSQRDNSIYTGCRNGSIFLFDKRMGNQGQKLFNDGLHKEPRSVLYLEPIGDYQLLASHINGDLVTFDLRYSRQSTPLTTYLGHTNSCIQNLGIALDPDQDFLFAAGQDQRVRGWSVRTGLPLLPSPTDTSDARQNPFLINFADVVETIHITAEREGLCLWAACDKMLYQFHLGQRR